jgi:hypothetical protein
MAGLAVSEGQPATLTSQRRRGVGGPCRHVPTPEKAKVLAKQGKGSREEGEVLPGLRAFLRANAVWVVPPTCPGWKQRDC